MCAPGSNRDDQRSPLLRGAGGGDDCSARRRRALRLPIPQSGSLRSSLVLFALFVGPAHVASTGFFYFDRNYWPVLRRYWPHCLASIAVLPAIFVGVLLASGVASALLFGGYVIWQSYHFGRQSYGLIALAAGSEKHGPLPRLLVPMLNIAAVGGAIGSLGASAIYPIGTVLARCSAPRLPTPCAGSG